jgi:hypothetical protein
MRQLTALIIACLFASEASAASSLDATQQSVLAAWLKRSPEFHLVSKEDCDCDADIKQMREVGPWGVRIPDFEPYILVGDFRGNGQSDFAVVVMGNDVSDQWVVIFDGPFERGTSFEPAYFGRHAGPIKHLALFQTKQYGWPILGPFDSEGCLYKPHGRTYTKDCGNF